jgi:glyoxylase-like metal-dependent hydrolase (beta-lactamase superfamily II)
VKGLPPLIVAAFALAAAPSQGPIAAAPTVSADSGHLETVDALAPHVWLIRQIEPFQVQPVGNVMVIEQGDGLILIDSGGSPGSGRRVAALAQSVAEKPVKAVVLTHWHPDHPLGVPAILERWPAVRIIAHRRTRDHLLGAPMRDFPRGAPDHAAEEKLTRGAEAAMVFLQRNAADASLSPRERDGFDAASRALRALRADMAGVRVIAPTEVFDQKLVIPDPDVPVEILHMGRANTDGDAIAWLPRQRIVATGDIVVSPVPFGFGSYPADWIETLGKIRALDFAILVPGHGHPQKDTAYLDRLVGLIAEVRRQAAPLAASGVPLDEARARIDLSRHKVLFAGTDPWLGRWFDQYWVRPFVAAAWREAKGLEIVQGD